MLQLPLDDGSNDIQCVAVLVHLLWSRCGIFPVHSDSSHTLREKGTNTANKPEEKDKRRQQVNHSNNVSIIHRINTINRYVHFVVVIIAFNNCNTALYVANIISSLLCANSQCTCVIVAMPSIVRVNLGVYGVNSTLVCIQWG